MYLLLNVAQDQKLIEKHAKAAGVDAKVEWVKLSGGSAVNDALLSGNIEIAGEAYLSEATVKSHVRSVLQKLGMRNRVQIVVFAYENGLVPASDGGPRPRR